MINIFKTEEQKVKENQKATDKWLRDKLKAEKEKVVEMNKDKVSLKSINITEKEVKK